MSRRFFFLKDGAGLKRRIKLLFFFSFLANFTVPGSADAAGRPRGATPRFHRSGVENVDTRVPTRAFVMNVRTP